MSSSSVEDAVNVYADGIHTGMNREKGVLGFDWSIINDAA